MNPQVLTASSGVSFRSRRIIGVLVTTLAISFAILIVFLIDTRLGHASVFSGTCLLTCLFGLLAIGLRRRLPILPLGSVSSWTQVHLYVGFFSSAVYWMHVPAVVGTGFLESTLSLFFLAVTASGFYGIYASRTLPRRLTAVQGQHRFDRMVWHRDQIAGSAEALIMELDDASAGQVLRPFYDRHLKSFFDTRTSLAYLIFPTGTRRRQVTGRLKELDRYLQTEGRGVVGKLIALVRYRDDLDYQFALQLRLRVWLVVHGAMSVVLIFLSVLHAIVAYSHLG